MKLKKNSTGNAISYKVYENADKLINYKNIFSNVLLNKSVTTVRSKY